MSSVLIEDSHRLQQMVPDSWSHTQWVSEMKVMDVERSLVGKRVTGGREIGGVYNNQNAYYSYNKLPDNKIKSFFKIFAKCGGACL